jgi:hypothetical protein
MGAEHGTGKAPGVPREQAAASWTWVAQVTFEWAVSSVESRKLFGRVEGGRRACRSCEVRLPERGFQARASPSAVTHVRTHLSLKGWVTDPLDCRLHILVTMWEIQHWRRAPGRRDALSVTANNLLGPCWV